MKIKHIFILLFITIFLKIGIEIYYLHKGKTTVFAQNKNTNKEKIIDTSIDTGKDKKIPQKLKNKETITEKVKKEKEKQQSEKSIDTLIEEIKKEKEKLKKKEEELNKKEEILKSLNLQLQAKLEEMRKIKNEIEKMINKYMNKKQTEYQKTIDELVKMYSAMDPKAAAKALEKMDTELAVEIFANFNPRTAGEIMNSMNSDKIVEITKKLIEKRKPPVKGDKKGDKK